MFEAAIRELRSGEKKLSSLYRNPASAGDGSKPIAWFVKGRRNTVSTLQSIIEEASAEILMEQPLSLLSSTLGRLATKSKRGGKYTFCSTVGSRLMRLSGDSSRAV
ncbi:hypothetical protein B9Q09_05715 [Candidatus Marsarchaeota G2 archaeon ECH_B_SAG-C16]|uniref:Transcription regulator TrmB C-terminal domain-containing protein n=1 Tax=Candidatus Marsarchaeota G2 archaeon ECH_B_SAG-C16 TaxID=1978163 RepID=A0A2R6B4D3_9ARCH|nr:MAG: hypothetical protein B9Q09_05715 [Candidatus Marsarchaeota G2 archaeon ECH_B_SAG-C16]